MSERRKQFVYDVVKNLIDKLFIGAIVGVVAFNATQVLEENKSVNNAYIELNKTKIMKLAEVWEQAYLLDTSLPVYKDLYTSVDHDIKSKLIQMQQKLKNGYPPRKAEQEVLQSENEITREFQLNLVKLNNNYLKSFNDTLNKNKFWLDDEHLKTLLEYSKVVNEIARLTPLKTDSARKKLVELRKEASEFSKTINDVRDQLLRQKI